MTEFEKMGNGLLFNGDDEEILAIRHRAFLLLQKFNKTPQDMAHSIALELFGHIGSQSMIMPFFQCEFGRNIHVGNDTFINMGVVMLDGASITIGNNVMVGPNTQFYTPGHSLDYRSRRRWETFCKSIVVEDDVWIGGSCVICQGVTIGARSVIAANSVVTRDVPADVLFGGTPAQQIRPLHENEMNEMPLQDI